MLSQNFSGLEWSWQLAPDGVARVIPADPSAAGADTPSGSVRGRGRGGGNVCLQQAESYNTTFLGFDPTRLHPVGGHRGFPHLQTPGTQPQTPPPTPNPSFGEGSRPTSSHSTRSGGGLIINVHHVANSNAYRQNLPLATADETPPVSPMSSASNHSFSSSFPESPLRGFNDLSISLNNSRPSTANGLGEFPPMPPNNGYEPTQYSYHGHGTPINTAIEVGFAATAREAVTKLVPPDGKRSKNSLKQLRKHTKKTCGICGREVSAIKRHMRSMHNDVGNPAGRVKVICPISYCGNAAGFYLDRMDNLRQHLILKHRCTKDQADRHARDVVQNVQRN
ncbi:hypothetical protein BZA05DRAFT_49589 [Tricharina praecox]|uniref:uncharacterized protein n=1 Tax=Tricharina praecox TaxID=43433 RepID=UPI002220E399|nr:uncharacterized protein BZA05DRAFT_49589 [Tricharina praecox]KAI5852009.1 hypothetical protein BZA05DRAFT_49589 [Tricharina praecox]